MADVSKSGTPSMCTPSLDANRLPPLQVGEDIAAGDACYIKSDGKIWRSDKDGSLGAAAEVDGWAPQAALVAQRQFLSLHYNVNFAYGSGLTPGSFCYLGDSGALVDTPAGAQTNPIARVIDATRIHVFRTYPGRPDTDT
jgi:hypothetical protein